METALSMDRIYGGEMDRIYGGEMSSDIYQPEQDIRNIPVSEALTTCITSAIMICNNTEIYFYTKKFAHLLQAFDLGCVIFKQYKTSGGQIIHGYLPGRDSAAGTKPGSACRR